MSAQNKPGPWRVGMESGHNACIVYAEGDNSVCQVYGIWQNATVDECAECEGMPAARLIAAAPDLLAALTYMLSCIDQSAHFDHIRGGVMGGAFDKANAAISKATGQPLIQS